MSRIIELNDDDLEYLECYSKFSDISFKEAIYNNYVTDNYNYNYENVNGYEYSNPIEDRYLSDNDCSQIDDYDNNNFDY